MDAGRVKFIESVAAKAQACCHGTGLFPSLMIAQACLESNDGESGLSRNHHNYFGIKASQSWTGHVTSPVDTTEYVKNQPVKVKQTFRSYASIDAGFADRVRFLQVNKRYALAGVFKCTTPEGQARCFLKAGYATDPAYPQKLINIINIYHLKRFDTPS